ncbi:MAG: glycosyltransferase family 39 protein [Candidatus Kapabacteria bacterium]|nr:glycosyltransferase family 39 protein [Candidatus Kapabacteria bacterium]
MHNKAKNIALILILAVISLPALLFPLSGDLSVMFLGGKFIANGGRIFVDFIDIKQPLIYYIFALSNIIFGDSEISPRILDYIIQISTAIITFFVVKRISGKTVIAFLAPLSYLIAYISLNYSNTAQCESFSGLILILLLYLFTKEKIRVADYLIIGSLIGILGGLKVTFLIIIFALPLLMPNIINSNGSKSIINYVFIFFGLVLLLFLTHLPLLNKEIFYGFKDAWAFLSFYSDFPPFNIDFLRESLKKTAIFFGDNFSIFLFFSSFWALKLILTDSVDTKEKKLLNTAFIFIIFLFLSVVIERKMMVYHFSRFLLPLAIVSSFGIYSLFQILKDKYQSSKTIMKFGIYILVLLLLLFSPIPRYFNLLAMSYKYFFNEYKYNQMFSDDTSSSNNRIEQLEVINHLKEIDKNDFVLVINSGGNIINHYIEGRTTGFGHSCFYLSVFKVDNWRQKFFEELKIADWLVIQKNDRHYFMTRTNLSSYELIMEDSLFSDIIRNQYLISKEFKNFALFKRKI